MKIKNKIFKNLQKEKAGNPRLSLVVDVALLALLFLVLLGDELDLQEVSLLDARLPPFGGKENLPKQGKVRCPATTAEEFFPIPLVNVHNHLLFSPRHGLPPSHNGS